jgi:uncharacterized protein YkuJ
MIFASPVFSQVDDSLERPVCGDDQSEYLIEEMGESRNSVQGDGDYACTPDRSECFYNSTDSEAKLYDQGQYAETEEPDEEVGRFKQDEEYCYRTSDVDFGTWWDQDYGDVNGDGTQETCRTNTLWGTEGVRWMDRNYVETHPEAVKGGIDDDWNTFLENEHDSGTMSGYYDSKPWKDSYSTGETPVPTGSNNRSSRPGQERKIDTKGFCGGDDGAEYLLRQRCETNLCETDNDIVGVADDPDKCILEGDQVNAVESVVNNNRDIYSEGDLVELNGGSDVMACFGGTWNNEWPVTFIRDQVDVPLGNEDRISFRVINVEGDASTFDLELSFPDTDAGNDIDALTNFEKSGSNEMTVTVAASSSQTFNLRVRGNREVPNYQEVELTADSQDASLEGSDRVDVKITNTTGTSNASGVQTQDVPGMTWYQLVWLMMMASAFYFMMLKPWN